MGDHHAFRMACRTRGILQHCNVGSRASGCRRRPVELRIRRQHHARRREAVSELARDAIVDLGGTEDPARRAVLTDAAQRLDVPLRRIGRHRDDPGHHTSQEAGDEIDAGWIEQHGPLATADTERGKAGVLGSHLLQQLGVGDGARIEIDARHLAIGDPLRMFRCAGDKNVRQR